MPTRKLFSEDFLDVGLLSASSGLEAGVLLDDNEIFGEFKGPLATLKFTGMKTVNLPE